MQRAESSKDRGSTDHFQFQSLDVREVSLVSCDKWQSFAQRDRRNPKVVLTDAPKLARVLELGAIRAYDSTAEPASKSGIPIPRNCLTRSVSCPARIAPFQNSPKTTQGMPRLLPEFCFA